VVLSSHCQFLKSAFNLFSILCAAFQLKGLNLQIITQLIMLGIFQKIDQYIVEIFESTQLYTKAVFHIFTKSVLVFKKILHFATNNVFQMSAVPRNQCASAINSTNDILKYIANNNVQISSLASLVKAIAVVG
jgi:hypothetical protein